MAGSAGTIKNPSPKKGQPQPNMNSDIVTKGLASSHKVKEGTLCKTNFDNYAKNVEAILINPNWMGSSIPLGGKKQLTKPFTIEDFAQLQFSKNLMIDGLLFVWVEKDIIFDVIKVVEK